MSAAVQAFTGAAEFLASCGPELLATRDTANNLPLASTFALRDSPASAAPGDIWLSARWETTIAGRDAQPALCIVAVVGPSFPVVLGSSFGPAQIPPADRFQAMESLATALASSDVPTARVSAVVGPRALLDPFVDAWSRLRSVTRKAEPHLHIYLSHVTPALLRPLARPPPPGWEFRLAAESDMDDATSMCQRFAARGRYPLSEEAARAHAKSLIDSNQMWLCVVHGKAEGVVAMVRPTNGVRAISKVWTNEGMRGQGLAAALVREACERAFSAGVQKVCLYVEPTNVSAMRCYGSVGFVGLEGGAVGEGTEEWMDVGFEDIALGKWSS